MVKEDEGLLILPEHEADQHTDLQVDVLLPELTELIVELLNLPYSCAHLLGPCLRLNKQIKLIQIPSRNVCIMFLKILTFML